MCDFKFSKTLTAYKRDIIVKNSIKPQTYIDYETAHMFYETSILNELPEPILYDIMRMCFRDHVMEIPKHINFYMSHAQHQRTYDYGEEHIIKYIDNRRPMNGTLEKHKGDVHDNYICYNSKNGFLNKYKCKCKTKKGTWCKSDASFEFKFRLMPCHMNDVNNPNDDITHLEYMEHYNNIIQLLTINTLGHTHHTSGIFHNERPMIDLRLKMCLTHEKMLKKDWRDKRKMFQNVYDYYKLNGYIVRNGYVCKIARGDIYR